jgi:4'-phosphopantetheinyl transferase
MLKVTSQARSGASIEAERLPPPAPGIDRRSPQRPRFLPGWRKSIPLDGADQSTVTEAKPDAIISVWASRADTLLAAPSNFRLLTDDDQSSLRKIRPGAQRDSAVAAKILLRLSLSLTMGRRVEPTAWRFATNEFGKPFVAPEFASLEFSVAHTDAVVMVAISQGVKVGIDVESIDQQFDDTVIGQFCDAAEQSALYSLPPYQRLRSLIQLWTQKEAYTKMLGVGHSLEFRSFSLPMHGGIGSHPSRMMMERFYFLLDESLYHAALALDYKPSRRLLDVRLIQTALPGDGTCALSPVCQ